MSNINQGGTMKPSNSTQTVPEKKSGLSSKADTLAAKKKAKLSFGLFFIFFVYYMGTAILQTPSFKHIASIPLFGMPTGLFLSLMVFPVSWLLIAIYFRAGR